VIVLILMAKSIRSLVENNTDPPQGWGRGKRQWEHMQKHRNRVHSVGGTGSRMWANLRQRSSNGVRKAEVGKKEHWFGEETLEKNLRGDDPPEKVNFKGRFGLIV